MARQLVFGLFFVLFFHFETFAALTFSYQGRLFDTSGDPIASGSSTMVLQVRDPSGECLLYEESHELQMNNSDGYFRVLVGLGVKNTSTAPNLTLNEILSNNTVIADGKLGCAGNQYSPSDGDHRIVRVVVDGVALNPDQVLGTVPYSRYANDSNTVGGQSYTEIKSYIDDNFAGSNLPDLTSIGNGQSIRWGAGGWELFTPGTSTITAGNGLEVSGSDFVVKAGTNVSVDNSGVHIVQGAGSNLDADLLDGLSSASFVQTESDPTVLASVKDGVSWNEVTGKPAIPDGNSLDASDGTPTNALMVDASGNVGIGTASPSQKLDVVGTVKATAFEGDGSALSGITASSISDNSITVADLDFASSDGVNIPQLASDPGTPTAGQIYYNTTSNKMKVYNGSSWMEVGSGATSGEVDFGTRQALTASTGYVAATAGFFLGSVYMSSNNCTINLTIDANTYLLLDDDDGAGNDTDVGLFPIPKGASYSYTTSGGSTCHATHSYAYFIPITGGELLGHSVADSDGDTKIQLEESANENIIRFDTSGAERMAIDAIGSVGIGTTSPNSSALLDIASTTKGFLPPRMTTAERNAIGSPATGLQIFNITDNKPNVYNGSAWEEIGSSSSSCSNQFYGSPVKISLASALTGLSNSTIQTILTQAITMPANCGNFRVQISYAIDGDGGSGNSGTIWIEDNSGNKFAPTSIYEGNGPLAAQGSTITTTEYSNSANVTFYIKVKGYASVRSTDRNSVGVNPTWLQLQVVKTD